MAKGTGVKGKPTDDLPKAKFSIENFKKSLGLFNYLGHHKWMFVVGMFFLFASAGIGLYFPMISGKMFGVFGDSSSAKDILEEKLIARLAGIVQGVVVQMTMRACANSSSFETSKPKSR